MISLNKTIAYTKNWKYTFIIALILGAFVPLLLITLEPFDNSNSFSYKYAILLGYAICIAIPLIILHPIENYIYEKQTNRWFVINEFFYILLSLLVIFLFSFFYHFIIIRNQTSISIELIWSFVKFFCLPFTPIVVPLWLYLRSKYGIIEVPLYDEKKLEKSKSITITGTNKSEVLAISESDFIYAKAQQNYVDVYFDTESGTQQKTLRSTLSNIMKQLPNAWQVHRSYLVNLDYLKSIEGNARKRSIRLSQTEEVIPISQMYYKALSARLSNSSQKLQD